jgi:rod shape-determining protein MreC
MLDFLSRHRAGAVGAVLGLLALGLVSSGRQGAGPIGQTLGVIGGPAHAVVHGSARWVENLFDHYVFLLDAGTEADRLRTEVSGLRSELLRVQEVAQENRRLRGMLDYAQNTDLALVPARVVGRSASTWYRSVVLDKGSLDGIPNEAAVVCPDGVVGRTYEVGPHQSRVLLLTDASSAVDAIVQRTRAQIIVEGRMSPFLNILYLSRSSQVAVGDRVVTSGFDGIYPKGLLLGQIADLRTSASGVFQTAELQPSVDFARVEEVFVALPHSENPP